MDGGDGDGGGGGDDKLLVEKDNDGDNDELINDDWINTLPEKPNEPFATIEDNIPTWWIFRYNIEEYIQGMFVRMADLTKTKCFVMQPSNITYTNIRVLNNIKY